MGLCITLTRGRGGEGCLTISCAGDPPTKPAPRGQPAPRAEVALPFLVQEARGPNLGTRSRPAPRAEVALLFLVQEARRPNLGTRGRPAPRAEVARRRRRRRRRRRDKTKSSNPNTEGGEKSSRAEKKFFGPVFP